MTDLTKDILKYSLILFAITAVTVLILGPIYIKTKPVIRKLEAEQNNKALKELFPDATIFEDVKLSKISIKAMKSDYGLLGFSFKGAAKGYGGPIVFLVGFDAIGNIKGIRILSHTETPGLGGRITEIKKDKYIWEFFSKTESNEQQLSPWFQKQFEGLTIANLKVVKHKTDESEIGVQAITGATITTQAMVAAIKGIGQQIFSELNEKRLKEIELKKDKLYKQWPSVNVNTSEDSDYYTEE
ncbi:FMN-binding protein [Candidatus Poribacteria bacterium]|nr:FMN-binding protein [Candidatus Poribacteria bacterium]